MEKMVHLRGENPYWEGLALCHTLTICLAHSSWLTMFTAVSEARASILAVRSWIAAMIDRSEVVVGPGTVFPITSAYASN